MERDWLDIVDDGVDDDDAPNPTRRDGTFRLYEFTGDASHLPTLLEQVASWARECAEYQIVDLSVSDDDGWSTVAVTVWEVSPGDLIKSLTSQGHADGAVQSPTSSANTACARACDWPEWRRTDNPRIESKYRRRVT